MRIGDYVISIWSFHRRALLICTGLIVALLAVLGVTALLVRATGQTATGGEDSRAGRLIPVEKPSPSHATPTARASDVRFWNAVPAVYPATSAAFPAVTGAATRDPSLFARAFATELFNRDYAIDRGRLLSWAQYEDAPLRAPNYPSTDWTKVLVDSLTDLTWDNALETPIPAEGPWLALRSARTTQSVRDVQVTLDQRWEQAVASGYQPADPLATARDVTLTLIRRSQMSGRMVVQRFAVSIALQLGSSPRGGYGVATTNNYVIKEIR
jgi:hypothetical protein